MSSDYEFQDIYEEYFGKISQYLSRIVGVNDAEDTAQEVFYKISVGLGKFRGQSKLSTWIYRIATNTAIDRLRSSSYRHSKEQKNIMDKADAEIQDVWGAPNDTATDQTLIRREMSECIIEFIDNLPPDDRTIIVLGELEGLTNKEIADVLEISLENVKIRLHRARAKLRAALNDGCDFYHNDENVLACDRKPVFISPRNTRTCVLKGLSM